MHDEHFSQSSTKLFRFFTEDGATKIFSITTLEKRWVFRATIEPDSQDVFLQVQQFRTLPYVVRLLFTSHVMDAIAKGILAIQICHDSP